MVNGVYGEGGREGEKKVSKTCLHDLYDTLQKKSFRSRDGKYPKEHHLFPFPFQLWKKF